MTTLFNVENIAIKKLRTSALRLVSDYKSRLVISLKF